MDDIAGPHFQKYIRFYYAMRYLRESAAEKHSASFVA